LTYYTCESVCLGNGQLPQQESKLEIVVLYLEINFMLVEIPRLSLRREATFAHLHAMCELALEMIF